MQLKHPLVNFLFLVLLEVEKLKPFDSDIYANAEPSLEIMGKLEHPLCLASEALPQKVAVSANRNVSLAGRWMLFLKVHSVQRSVLVGLFSFPLLPP